MTYIIMLVGIICTRPIINKRIVLKMKSYNGKAVYLFLWGAILITLCGLRSMSIGNDTSQYAWSFYKCQQAPSFKSWLSSYVYIEYAYYLIMFLISRIGDYQLFLCIMALIAIGPVIFTIYKYSDDPTISLVLYVCFSYYTMCMSEMRQAAAMGLTMIAYHFLRKRKVVPYLILCIIAFFFHTSALIFLPMYWVGKVPNNQKIRLAAIVGIICAYIFKGKIWAIATLFARQQYTANEAGGLLMYVFMLLSVVLGYMYRGRFLDTTSEYDEKDSSYKELFYMQVIAAMLWPMASINSATARIYYYFHLPFVLYVPAVLKSIKNKYERLLITQGYYLVAFYFLYSQIFRVSRHVNPYMFFWQ